MLSNKCVKILERENDEGLHELLFDHSSGLYKVPIPIWDQKDFVDSMSFVEILKRRKKTFKRTARLAVLDTGVMTKHPLIQMVLEKAEDFTEEQDGVEDENGHGTLVSLIAILSFFPSPNISLLSGKILDSKGEGTEDSMIKGFQWAIQEKVDAINLSAGIIRSNWPMLGCKGDCKICRIAEKAVQSGIAVFCAAGNDRKLVCPAKVGVVKPESGIRAVAELDYRTRELTEYSATGNCAQVNGPRYFINTKPNDEEILNAYIVAAKCCSGNKNYKDAISLYQKVIDQSINIYGRNHIKTAIFMNKLGLSYMRINEYDKAIKEYLCALDNFSKAINGVCRQAVFVRFNIVIALKENGDLETAKKQLQIALKIAEEENIEEAVIEAKKINDGLELQTK